MKISYKWLLELTGLDLPVEEVAERLTLCGTACEDIEATAEYMDKVVVGQILEIKPVEGADKIKQTKVDVGSEQLDIICGAPNIEVNQKVPVALIGAKLTGGFMIKKAKIRGVESFGMICSQKELGISDDHSGIWVLGEDAKIGQALAEYLDYDDYILTFELTPNRADSTSAIGIARDLAALAEVELIRPEIKINEAKEKAEDFIRVSSDDPIACPRYAARIIKNVKVGQSPWWLQKKIITAGMRPINNIVDITNLVMLEIGHPLHAFDLKQFGSDEVVVRMAKDKEHFKTLDGNDHELTSEVILITNGKEAVAAGGVMGGLNSEVEDNTTEILLEAAYFNPSMIRKSRKLLELVTESSTRFEKGADPNHGLEFAINRAAYLFQELCGGEVLEGIVDYYPNKIEPKEISLRPKRCNDILGIEIPKQKMVDILTNLELKVEASDPIKVWAPTFRPDLEREIDLIEEVGRIIGYGNIPDSETNIGALFTPTHFEDSFKSELRTVLTGCGFDEILGHGLADKKLADKLNPGLPQLNLVNPVSEDINIMRNSIMQTALKVIEHNISHRNLDLQLFEIGKIYNPPDKNDNWEEPQKLLLTVSGNSAGSWREKPRPLDFYDLTGALEKVWNHFKFPEIELAHCKYHWFTDDISFSIILDDRVVGVIGKINQTVLKDFGIKQEIYTLELFIDPLINFGRQLISFEPMPVYPSAPRDLAILVNNSVKAVDIVNTVKNAAGDLAQNVKIFDLYTGKQVEKGKKSIAIAINYRSLESSLTSKQVDEKQRLVVDALKQNLNAEIRDK